MVDPAQPLTRRRVLLGGAGVGALALIGGAAWAVAPERVKARLGLGPEPYVPDAPEGRITLETVRSTERGKDVGLFTAVPAGFGAGTGLPVVVVLHGASATTADYQGFGLGRFLTQAVRDGAAPFALVGVDGGVLRWEPDPAGGDDPQAMVLRELPHWISQRGFDADRRALWGWSMGGYGSLRIAELAPDFAAAVAAFSPAVDTSDAVFSGAAALAGEPLAIWCGTEDGFFPAVRSLVDALPEPPVIASFGPGGHTREYWNNQTLQAFSFLSRQLAA